MAEGLGFKTFTTGEVLTAADVNGYLMQGVLVFASEAARDAAITSPQEGQFAFTKDNNSLWYYSGAAWVASGATGDIEGVTAGTGISGGGTSGTVTITNSMATEIDAKADLVVGTGADTFARLAVGTDGFILQADSSVSPQGLKWAVDPVADVITTAGDLIYGTAADTVARLGIGTVGQVLKVNSGATAPEWAAAAGASFVGCNIYRNSNVSIPNATATAIEYNTEVFDTDAFHDNSTNPSRVTIPAGKGGKYLFTAWNNFASNATGYRNMDLFINGTTLTGSSGVGWTPNASGNNSGTIAVILDLVATDYVEVLVTQTSGGNLNLTGNIYGSTGLSCVYLGA